MPYNGYYRYEREILSPVMHVDFSYLDTGKVRYIKFSYQRLTNFNKLLVIRKALNFEKKILKQLKLNHMKNR